MNRKSILHGLIAGSIAITGFVSSLTGGAAQSDDGYDAYLVPGTCDSLDRAAVLQTVRDYQSLGEAQNATHPDWQVSVQGDDRVIDLHSLDPKFNATMSLVQAMPHYAVVIANDDDDVNEITLRGCGVLSQDLDGRANGMVTFEVSEFRTGDDDNTSRNSSTNTSNNTSSNQSTNSSDDDDSNQSNNTSNNTSSNTSNNTSSNQSSNSSDDDDDDDLFRNGPVRAVVAPNLDHDDDGLRDDDDDAVFGPNSSARDDDGRPVAGYGTDDDDDDRFDDDDDWTDDDDWYDDRDDEGGWDDDGWDDDGYDDVGWDDDDDWDDGYNDDGWDDDGYDDDGWDDDDYDDDDGDDD